MPSSSSSFFSLRFSCSLRSRSATSLSRLHLHLPLHVRLLARPEVLELLQVLLLLEQWLLLEGLYDR